MCLLDPASRVQRVIPLRPVQALVPLDHRVLVTSVLIPKHSTRIGMGVDVVCDLLCWTNSSCTQHVIRVLGQARFAKSTQSIRS